MNKLLKEIWKPVVGFENLYEISSFGRVKSLAHSVKSSNGKTLNYRERIVKQVETTSGYKFIVLTKNKESKNFSVHRLVAESFIENTNNYTDVNHKDGNKKNNCVENLEWCTRSENLKHAINIGLIKNQCKICRKVTVKCGEKITVFETMKDCAEFFGFKRGWLHNQIRNHGLTFVYKNYQIIVSERSVAGKC